MLFNSFEFLLFFPVVFYLYWFIFNKSIQAQNVFTLLASYFFYGWWSYKFLILLILSTLLDYFYGFWVASPNRRKAKLFLILSIGNNLGILAIFKYYNFFANEFQRLCTSFGFHVNISLLVISLPIGISFYTFHGMSYVFDIYRHKQKPVNSFVDYALFVSFFPLLVAGPIERANHLLVQVQKSRVFNYNQAIEGCRLVLWGMFKKVVIADNLAVTVNNIFGNYQHESGLTLIVGAIAFSFQIYGDFSGYSDIALGTAKLLGFELLSNFKFPYFSRNIAEFWQRWHISLSSWFRDYLYIPIGGSRNGKIVAVRNTFIIFLVSGFWHGASWNFIVWGFIHACGFLPLLLLDTNRRYVQDTVAQNTTLPTFKEVMQMSNTFAFVTIAWVFFRADSIKSSIAYLKRIVFDIYQYPSQLVHLPNGKMAFIYIIPLVIGDWWLRHDERNLKVPQYTWARESIYWVMFSTCFTYLVIDLFKDNKSNFIYFQF